MIEFLSAPLFVLLAWLAFIGVLLRLGSTSLRAHRAKKAPAFGSKRARPLLLDVFNAHYPKIVAVALSVGGLLWWTFKARDIQRDVALRAPDQTQKVDVVIEFDVEANRAVDMNDPEAVQQAIRAGVIPTVVLPWRNAEDRDAAIEADAKRGREEVDRIKAAHDALPDKE